MKKKFLHLTSCFFLAFMLIASLGNAQNISVQYVGVSANPTDCNTFTVTSSGPISSLSYTIQNYSYAVSPGFITVKLVFNDPFIIVPALGTYQHTATVNTLNDIPAGNYTVIVEAYRGVNLESSLSAPATVAACCVMNANIVTNDQFICAGDSALLVSNSVGATQLTWSDASGQSISSNDSIAFQFNNQGIYTYILEANNGACSGFDTVTISVDTIPTFDLGMNLSVCENSPVSLDATVADPNATYLWSDSSTTGMISANVTGTYIATVNINNCSYSDTIDVIVNPNPSVTLPNDTLVCFGNTVTLDVTQTGLSYNWNTGSTMGSIAADSSQTYTVTVTDANNCTATADFALVVAPEIVINLADTATIPQGDSILLDAGVWVSYLWSTGDTTATIYASSSNLYTVTVTDINGCSASASISAYFVNDAEVSIPTVSVFPNPTAEILNIETGQLAYSIQKAAIYNQIGQLVNISNLENGNQINVSTLQTGIYFIRLLDANDKVLGVGRFLKE